jgi:hypothetical protein
MIYIHRQPDRVASALVSSECQPLAMTAKEAELLLQLPKHFMRHASFYQ